MKAVFSYRTLPALMREDNEWRSTAHMIKAIICAVRLAQRNISPDVVFYADAFGKKWLEQFLPDIQINDFLEGFDSTYPPEMYTISKLWVYQQQKEAFVHSDFDAFCLRKFDLNKPVVAMFREGVVGNAYYDIPDFVGNHGKFVSIPQSWQHLKDTTGKFNGFPIAANAGVFGGTDIEFWQRYCDETTNFLKDNIDLIVGTGYQFMKSLNLSIEQFTLPCLADQMGREVTCLFKDGMFKPWNEEWPHLLAYEKMSVTSCNQLDKLYQKLFGDFTHQDAVDVWDEEAEKYQ